MKAIASIASLLVVSMLAVLTGCASVPMASAEQNAASKSFATPTADHAGLYVYRDSFVGKALKKSVFLDGVEIGETANKVYLHRLISLGSHTLSTESEFGNNDVKFVADSGRNYFFEQSMKMGVFSGGASLTAVFEADGKRAVLDCEEAAGVTTPAAGAQAVTVPQP